MDLPLGKRNGPGRPKNAVKGALNWQGVKHPKINLIDVAIAAELNNKKQSNHNDTETGICNKIFNII